MERRQKQEKRYQIIGESGEIKKVWDDIKAVAPTNTRVMITGESGTGKELVSFWIHQFSQRKNKPFIKVNCAAIPRDLIESELFGHEKGAFTGAYKRQLGKFEMAHMGTIFLDEIGDMAMSTQAKVLRVIEDGEFRRIGGMTPIKVDVRIISATNKNIPEEIKKGNFRDDLYHRINVFQIYIPPLRMRRTDIILLAKHFVEEYCRENNFPITLLTKEAKSYISTLDFAGNIRELKNVIERAIIISDQNKITKQNLISSIGAIQDREQNMFINPMKLSEAKNNLEKKYLETQLAVNDWNISKTAKKLGLQRSNLSRRMKQLHIKKK